MPTMFATPTPFSMGFSFHAAMTIADGAGESVWGSLGRSLEPGQSAGIRAVMALARCH